MTERKIELTIMQSNGKTKTVTQDFVPAYKADEYYSIEAELEEEAKKSGRNVTASEYSAIQRKFVADLFDDESVTEEALREGLDALDNAKLKDIIRYRVLGYDKEKDELVKKMETAQLLAGLSQEIDSEIRSED